MIVPGTRTALFVSPHLDDAVFSAGGTMAAYVDAGWRVVMATVFTRSVSDPQGFALACQLDKGLPPDLDYMALRRAEDARAAALLGVEARWLDLPEAPHRGYESAPALFAALLDTDGVWRDLAAQLRTLLDEVRPDAVLTCQGLGDHVDHRQVIRAVLDVLPADRVGFWRDTPYCIRRPDARPDKAVPAGPTTVLGVQAGLHRKIAASVAYQSQVGFQFGGPAACDAALRALAARDGGEQFLGRAPAPGDADPTRKEAAWA